MQLTLASLIGRLQEHGILLQNNLTPSQLNIVINTLAPLQQANNDDLAFLANPKYAHELASTSAAAVLLKQNQLDHLPAHTVPLVVDNPYLAYAILTPYFAYQSAPTNDDNAIHATAIIHPTAQLGNHVKIGAYAVIGEGASIGNHSQIDSHVVVEDFACIGQNCLIKPHVFIGHHCALGNNVTLHSHASIGNEGFGFAPKGDPATQGWQKIHQLGKVIIGNQVRIGSHTCIDRGALGDTIIGDNVIIDNLVQIAHNVQIGDGTAIAACTGIAGSSKIGKRCMLAGGVGMAGHIEVCDDVTFTGMTMVTKSITQAGSYSSGIPMLATPIWRRAVIKFKQLATR